MTTIPNSITVAAEEPPEGASPPAAPVSPTITHYQQLAAQVMAALDEIAAVIPNPEVEHTSTANFVRTHQSIPIEFLATATAAVEQTVELQGVKKLDVPAAHDTLQFIAAFRPVFDKLIAFAKKLQFTMNSRHATLSVEALRIYDIAKGIARDPRSAGIVSLVANMKRDLGPRGRPKTTSLALRKAAPAPGIGVPAPRVLAFPGPKG